MNVVLSKDKAQPLCLLQQFSAWTMLKGMDGWMDGWTDGRTDGHAYQFHAIYSFPFSRVMKIQSA